MSEPVATVRRLPHRPPPIIRATDLGGACVLKHGRQFLLTDPTGDVRRDARGLGLYDGDTRVVSCLELRVNGERPSLLRADRGGAATGAIHLTNPEMRRDPLSPDGLADSLAGRSLAITRSRRLQAGLHERFEVTNHTERARRVIVELLLDADMADIFEVQGHVRPRRGDHEPIEVRGDRITFAYRGRDGEARRTQVTTSGARIDVAPAGSDGAVVAGWEMQIEPGARATIAWSIVAELPSPGRADATAAMFDGPAPLADAATVRSDDSALDRVIARAVSDLALLVTPGPGAGQRHLAAGIPWFSTLFGRDAILASFAAAIVDPGLAVDTLRVLASLQAVSDDPTRDAEPGKIVHEVRDGEMARLGEVPFGRYYGAADTTPLFLILLGEAFDWTGDLDFVRELWPAARAALGWIDNHGDLDGDRFIEYRRRAPGGLVNQGWKDALDSIRDRSGAIAEGPIALAEVQGYAFDARVRVARLARALGDELLAGRLEADAARLKVRFRDAYWVPDLKSCALALDGTKRRMDAIGSNQGHALWSGIITDERARDVAERLGGVGLDSGWGIRTFAAGQPGYTPLGYHTGAVWPHDTAIAIAGLRRYGFDQEATRLAGELLAAAGHFPDGRLPELFCGFGADEVEAPVPYPVACAPQAWAAAAPLLVLRELLGLRPRAGEGMLEIDRPCLPAGVTSLKLSGLRVGQAQLDLAFHRWRDATAVEVIRKTGNLAVHIRT